jgi:DNA-binding response OmpR family regulator
MSKGSILIVDDDQSLTNLLKLYLEADSYIVQVLSNGRDAISEAQSDNPPEIIVLNVILPDMSGYDVCRELRTNSQTSSIPMLFLIESDERGEKIIDLELGQDDYFAKPINFSALEYRIAYYIEYSRRSPLINPISGFPSGELIENHLREVRKKKVEWAQIELKIQHYAKFKETYGWHAGDEVIRLLARTIIDGLDEYGTAEDFAGHSDEAGFVLISYSDKVQAMIEQLKSRFDKEVQGHYAFFHRDEGVMRIDGEAIPLMSLAISHEQTPEAKGSG